MKLFESFLSQHLEQYLSYRKQLGYSIHSVCSRLLAIDRYLQQQNAHWDLIQPVFFSSTKSKYLQNPQHGQWHLI